MLNNDSRTKNSLKNVSFSLICQIIILVCSFISRTIFIKILGSSYLGINGLFTNILSVLSMADLGFDTAIVYSMYKPIANKDTKKISALMNFYKKIYLIIGSIIGIIGIALIPFLKYFVNLSTEIDNISLYYVLYLSNTVLTYFLANRVAIITADQKAYIIKKYTLFFKILQTILEIIILIIFKNFLLYLLIQILCTFFTNLYGTYKAKKMYPFLKQNKLEKIEKKEKKKIFSDVKSMFVYKIGGIILNNTDNILISILVSTEMVGYYGNYTMIITAVTTMATLVFSSLTASIGNLNAKENTEKRINVFNKVDFLATWTYGFCSICMLVLINPFIELMWGKEYAINMLVPLAAIINFEIVGLLHPLRLYRETTGVFREVKYIFIWTSLLNLIFSIYLGNVFNTPEMKLFGIIIATAIARIMTTVWFEPKKIFNSIFKRSSIDYFKRKLRDVIILIITGGVTYYICALIGTNNLINFIIKGLICLFVINIIYYMFYHKSNEFNYYYELLKEMIKKFKKNILKKQYKPE